VNTFEKWLIVGRKTIEVGDEKIRSVGLTEFKTIQKIGKLKNKTARTPNIRYIIFFLADNFT